MNEALSALTSFVIDGIEPSGSVTRVGEVHRIVSGENGRCMQLAQGRV